MNHWIMQVPYRTAFEPLSEMIIHGSRVKHGYTFAITARTIGPRITFKSMARECGKENEGEPTKI